MDLLDLLWRRVQAFDALGWLVRGKNALLLVLCRALVPIQSNAVQSRTRRPRKKKPRFPLQSSHCSSQQHAMLGGLEDSMCAELRALE